MQALKKLLYVTNKKQKQKVLDTSLIHKQLQEKLNAANKLLEQARQFNDNYKEKVLENEQLIIVSAEQLEL